MRPPCGGAHGRSGRSEYEPTLLGGGSEIAAGVEDAAVAELGLEALDAQSQHLVPGLVLAHGLETIDGFPPLVYLGLSGLVGHTLLPPGRSCTANSTNTVKYCYIL